MYLQSYPIPNLINGVSQQAPSQRRDTQCEFQRNCINSPVEGAIARPPTELVRFIPGLDVSGGYYFTLLRSVTEKYVVVVRSGSVRAWNLVTGLEATISTPNGVSYLTTVGDPAQTFRHVTVEDTTFLVNRTVVPVVDNATRSPTRPFEAIAFFRAGNYAETYTVTIPSVGTYGFRSAGGTAGNEPWIKTNYLAQALEAYLTGATTFANTTATNTGTDIRTLGFTVTRDGSGVYISRSTDFGIKAQDGAADNAFRVIKDQVQKFSDLPQSGFSGFTIKVAGQDAAVEDDYWVQFKLGGAGNSTGLWEEVVAPNTALGFDDNTMPWALTSTGLNTFTFTRQSWAKRVAGDGTIASRNPEFTGKPIQDLFFHRGRFGILTEGSVTFSAARQFFTFFPSTAQTKLASDPISYKVAHTKVALLKDAVAYNEQLLLWADGVQFRVDSGEVMEEANVEIIASSEFSYNPECRPIGIGDNVYFASKNGTWSGVWEYFVTKQGTSKSAQSVNDQAPSYVPGDLVLSTGSAALRTIVFLSASQRNRLYTHSFFSSGDEKLQSAWNYWEFDSQTAIQVAVFDQNLLRLFIRRPDGMSIETLNCQAVQNDPGLNILIRLDRRVTEASLTSIAYNSGTNRSTFVVPTLTPQSEMVVVVRGNSTSPAGTEFPVVSIDAGTRTVTVEGNIVGENLYVGWRMPSALYTFSEFYPKDQRNIFIPLERVQLRYLNIVHSRTGYYRMNVKYQGGKEYVSEFTGRVLGEPTNMTDTISISDGEFRRPIKANARRVRVSLENDSYLPSAWQSAEWQFGVTMRARKGMGGQG